MISRIRSVTRIVGNSNRNVSLRLGSRRYQSTSVLTRLSEILKAEISHENSLSCETPDPCAIQGWVLEDKEGDVNITISRHVGNKEVKVQWQLMSEMEDEYPDEEESEPGKEPDAPPQSTDFTVTVEENKKGTIFYCSTVAGEARRVAIGNCRTFSSAEEKDCPNAYVGPMFDDLDDNLQQCLMDYVEELGIGGQLCDYIDSSSVEKERREYTRWLSHLKQFSGH